VRAGARGGLQRSQRSRDVGQRVCTVGLGSEVRTGMRVCLDMAAEQTEQTGVGSRCSRRSDATAARGSLSLVGSRPVTGLQPTNEGDSARPEALHWHRSLGPTSVPTLSCSCLASFRRSARHLPLLSRSWARRDSSARTRTVLVPGTPEPAQDQAAATCSTATLPRS
jgi:hypothetical protein